MPFLYVVHQASARAPALDGWMREAWEVLAPELASEQWQIVHIEANLQNGFDARAVHARVNGGMGPVVVLGALKDSAIAELRDKLMMSRAVVACESPTDSTDVYDTMRAAVDAHTSGDPHIPKKLVAAMFVLRKLEKRNSWGGAAMFKAFFYADELCNGGMPPEVAPFAHSVANFLRQVGLLGSKTSNRRLKYCLNGDRKSEIYDLLDSKRATDERVRKYLFSGDDVISARILDKYFAEDLDEGDDGDKTA